MFQRALSILQSYEHDSLKAVMGRKSITTQTTSKKQKYMIVVFVLNLEYDQFSDLIQLSKEQKDILQENVEAFKHNRKTLKEFIQGALTIIVPDPGS